VAGVVERLKALPGDLLAEVESAALAEGVPNLLSGTATDEQLAIVEELLASAEVDLSGRRLALDAALAGYADDPAVVAALVAASSPHGHTLERLTAWEVDVLVAIVAGIEAGQLGIDYGTGEPAIVAVGDIEAALVGRFATRGAALVALKATAEALGQPKPRSVAAAVTASPVLAAVAVHVDDSATPAA